MNLTKLSGIIIPTITRFQQTRTLREQYQALEGDGKVSIYATFNRPDTSFSAHSPVLVGHASLYENEVYVHVMNDFGWPTELNALITTVADEVAKNAYETEPSTEVHLCGPPGTLTSAAGIHKDGYICKLEAPLDPDLANIPILGPGENKILVYTPGRPANGFYVRA